MASASLASSGGVRTLIGPGTLGAVRARNNQSDTVMFEQVFVNEDYGFDLPFSPRTIIDAGANAGYASLYFANRFPEACILAIEPDHQNFELLRQNVAAFPQINPVRAGLWGFGGALRVVDPAASKCMITLAAANELGDDTLPALTVSEAISRLGAETVDLLKIDIEGAEIEVFNHAAPQWLRRVRALMIELHDGRRPGCARALYRALDGMEFLQFQRGDVLLILNQSAPFFPAQSAA